MDVDIVDGSSGNDGFSVAGADVVYGGAGDDAIYGDIAKWKLNSKGYIYGSVGSDSITSENGGEHIFYGGADDDVMKSGEIIYGDDGNDVITEAWNRAHGGRGDDHITGAGFLSGDSGNDVITGFAGAMYGGSGNDLIAAGQSEWDSKLMGGFGQDTLVGHDLGQDIFIFNAFTSVNRKARPFNDDVIRGFMQENEEDYPADKIDLSHFDTNKRLDGIQGLVFTGTQAKAKSVWYEQTNGGVIIHGDAVGNSQVDFNITVEGIGSLSAQDFIL